MHRQSLVRTRTCSDGFASTGSITRSTSTTRRSRPQARLVPKAWVKSDYLTRFENIATEFGPVDLKFQLSEDGKSLDVTFQGDWRHKPQRIVLHAPPIDGLERIVVNGEEHPADEEIEL